MLTVARLTVGLGRRLPARIASYTAMPLGPVTVHWRHG